MKKTVIATLATLLISSLALAQGPRGGQRGGGGPEAGPGGTNAIVADNGTIFVTRTVTDSATSTSSTQIVAITTSGTKAWTATLANRRGHLLLSGSNLLSVADAQTTDGAGSSTITALSTASGTTAWTLTRAGRITDLEPYSGGTYAIVVTPATATGGAASRSLIAISNSGAVLWSVSL